MSLLDDITGTSFGTTLENVGSNLLNSFGNQASNLAAYSINQELNKVDSSLNNAISKITGSPQPNFSFLNQAVSRPDPHLSYQWVVQMTGFGIDYGAYVEEITCSVGSNTIDTPVFQGGIFVNSPGEYRITALEVTMYEDRQLAANAFVYKWMRDFYDPDTGFYNYLNNAKRTISVTLCDGMYKKIATFTYRGCMPSDKSPVSLTSENGRSTVRFSINVEQENVKIYQYSIDGSNFSFLGSNNPISSAISGFISGIPQSVGSLFT